MYETDYLGEAVREFAKRIEFVCAAEMGGKLSQEKAYERIKTEWKYLKKSRKFLVSK